MIDMRWYHWYEPFSDENGSGLIERKKLQYRQMRPVRPNNAKEWRDDYRVMRWSPWRDIKEVWEDDK